MSMVMTSARRLTSTALLCLLSAVTAAAGQPLPDRAVSKAAKEEAGLDAFSPAQRKLVVNEAYASLARFAAAGGETLGFKLENFETVTSSRFGSVLWLDLVSMPGGDMLDVVREEKQFNGRTDAVIYRPKWSLGGEDFLTTAEGLSLFGKTAGDVLAELASKRPELAKVTAITSYRVTAHYGGRSRSYDAAVLWLAPRSGRRATLYFIDNITQGVEEAVRERPIRPRPRSVGPVSKSATCDYSSSLRRFDKGISGTNGHVGSGSHESAAVVDFRCTCEASCEATCESEFVTQYCDDSGGFTTDACHVMATNSKVSATGTQDGRSAGPACAAGFGCVQRACLFCVCSLGVEVTINGTGVQFTSSGGPEWEGNIDFSWQCAPCQESYPSAPDLPPGPENQEPPDFEGGGGSPSGCCSWQTSCSVVNGVYTCYPTGTCAVRGC